MANKSGFEIGDRIIIHGFKACNYCEGKTGTIIKLSVSGEHGGDVAKLDDGDGCCDINGSQKSQLPHDCIVVRYMENAKLIDSKPVDIEELI